MIKPPREARIAGVFEIHNCIFIAIELDIKEELPGTMCQPLILESGVLADFGAIEVGEYRRGRQTIETVVVEKDLHPHKTLGNKLACKIFMISREAGKNATHYHTPLCGASRLKAGRSLLSTVRMASRFSGKYLWAFVSLCLRVVLSTDNTKTQRNWEPRL
jgi:hypothetical protein